MNGESFLQLRFSMLKGHPNYKENKGGVSHNVALPFTLKRNCNAKEEFMETQIYFTMQKYT
jgi:hypothetical protein